MDDDMKIIKALEDKYGQVLFRMGLIHLMDIGVRNFTDEHTETSIVQITAEGEENKTKGIHTFMSSEFQREIIRCAAELSKNSVWTLLRYVNRHMYIAD